MGHNYISTFQPAQPFLQHMNYQDHKFIDATRDITLREFIAGCLSYYPRWIKALYGIRSVFVRLLGMHQPKMDVPTLHPQDVSFEKGADGTIFTVADGQEDSYWIASATDKHLTAHIIIAKESLANGVNRFYVSTTVDYHHWTGPVYFLFVKPFHHVVVNAMMKAGIERDLA